MTAENINSPTRVAEEKIPWFDFPLIFMTWLFKS